jgi:D-alanyl-lipoteichoic acid acyltransferase DltB (MBOAT superfamily)
VSSIITRFLDSGDPGIGAITSGSSGGSAESQGADIRYLYIPVGGSKNVAAATLLVFTFVALWHDLSFKLLAWGWLVSLFLLPEIAARATIPYEKVSEQQDITDNQYGHERWYRPLAGIGGVANLFLLMTANLVGFVLGVDGVRHLLTELTTSYSGWTFLVFACGCLYIAIQVMFEYREEERRRGIDRKC